MNMFEAVKDSKREEGERDRDKIETNSQGPGLPRLCVSPCPVGFSPTLPLPHLPKPQLENIMLAPDPVTGTVAKLVDFGLHKVIDDRIQKVVKRVVSEANMGLTRFRGLGGIQHQPVHEEVDELEEELAHQRMIAGNASPSHSHVATANGHASSSRFAPTRGLSFATGTGTGSLSFGREGVSPAGAPAGELPSVSSSSSLSTKPSSNASPSLTPQQSVDSGDLRAVSPRVRSSSLVDGVGRVLGWERQ